jgi:hypothetical protein
MTEKCSVSSLEHLKFGFVSNFVLRYSDFNAIVARLPNAIPLRLATLLIVEDQVGQGGKGNSCG